MKAEIFRGKDKLWYARLVARNGNTLFTSEGYGERRNAKGAVLSAMRGFSKGVKWVTLDY